MVSLEWITELVINMKVNITSKGGGSGDISVELVYDGVVAVALEDQLLIPQLLGHILRGRS